MAPSAPHLIGNARSLAWALGCTRHYFNGCDLATIWCVTCLVALLAAPLSAQADRQAEAEARAAASAEVAAWWGYPVTKDDMAPYGPENIGMERLRGMPAGFVVWRASIPVDHAAPSLVAFDGRHILRLGNFSSVELFRADQAIAVGVPNLQRRARLLARLADSYAAEEFFYPADSSPSGSFKTAEGYWRGGKPAGWAPDTLIELPDHRTVVAVTTFSRNAHSFGYEWHAFRYQFVFDKRKRLAGWARVEEWPQQPNDR